MIRIPGTTPGTATGPAPAEERLRAATKQLEGVFVSPTIGNAGSETRCTDNCARRCRTRTPARLRLPLTTRGISDAPCCSEPLHRSNRDA